MKEEMKSVGFWTNLASSVLSILAMLGVVKMSQASGLSGAVNKIGEGVEEGLDALGVAKSGNEVTDAGV